MKTNLLSFLKAIKLFDPDNTLSLSNLAMAVVVFKLATATVLDWTVLTAFFITLLNHNAKKHFNKARASKDIADQDRLQKVEDSVRQVNNMLAMKR